MLQKPSIPSEVFLGGILFDCIEITEAVFALLMLSCILWPSIFSLKMREALLETIFIILL